MDRRLELIGETTPAIWIHLVAALAALVVGAFVLWGRRGDARHRLLGRVWVGLMLLAAFTSAFIHDIRVIGPFSPIHAFTIITPLTLGLGMWAIRSRERLGARRALAIHMTSMRLLYAGGLLIAGGFTFLPYRLLGRLTLGESVPAVNLTVVALMVGTGLVLIVRTLHEHRRIASGAGPSRSPSERYRFRRTPSMRSSTAAAASSTLVPGPKISATPASRRGP